jgi:hypothetical protein
MMSVIVMIVSRPSVIILNVVMLNDVAPMKKTFVRNVKRLVQVFVVFMLQHLYFLT